MRVNVAGQGDAGEDGEAGAQGCDQRRAVGRSQADSEAPVVAPLFSAQGCHGFANQPCGCGRCQHECQRLGRVEAGLDVPQHQQNAKRKQRSDPVGGQPGLCSQVLATAEPAPALRCERFGGKGLQRKRWFTHPRWRCRWLELKAGHAEGVRARLHHVVDVAGHQQRMTTLRQLAHPRQGLSTCSGIQARGRFVQQDQTG